MKHSSPWMTALRLGAMALLLGAAAQAQTVRAMIPFDFVAGDKVLPAGEYRLAMSLRTGLIELTAYGQDGMYLPAHGCSFGTVENAGALLFHRYGDTYFLKRVKTAATKEGYEFFPTRRERDTARRNGVFEVAMVTTYGK